MVVRVAVLDCDDYKAFAPEVGFHYYGDRVEQWLGDPADGDNWSWTMFRVSESGALPALEDVAGFDGFVIPGSAYNATVRSPALCAARKFLSHRVYVFAHRTTNPGSSRSATSSARRTARAKRCSASASATRSSPRLSAERLARRRRITSQSTRSSWTRRLRRCSAETVLRCTQPRLVCCAEILFSQSVRLCAQAAVQVARAAGARRAAGRGRHRALDSHSRRDVHPWWQCVLLPRPPGV